MSPQSFDRPLIAALVERWWSMTHIFNFSDFEFGITLVDFYILTEIEIEGPDMISFPFDHTFESHEVFIIYLP